MFRLPKTERNANILKSLGLFANFTETLEDLFELRTSQSTVPLKLRTVNLRPMLFRCLQFPSVHFRKERQ